MDFFEIDTSMDDMGAMVLENAFINHFMPKAKGDYVKVYLYGLKLARQRNMDQVDDAHIASCLDMSEKEVRRAWEYWQKKKLIEFEPGALSNKIIFKNCAKVLMGLGPQEERDQDMRPVFTTRQQKTMKDIEKNALGRPFTVTEAIYFSTWFHDYEFTENMVALLLDYCTKKKQKDVRYWNKVAVSAFDAKIKTYDALSAFLKSYEQRQKRCVKILKYLGLYTGAVGEPEKKFIDKWFEEDHYTMKQILAACDESVGASKKSLRYVDAVLKNAGGQSDAAPKKRTKTRTASTGVSSFAESQNYDVKEVEKLLYGEFNEQL